MVIVVITLRFIIRYIYNFFRKLKFRYKLSIYFILFGLMIGYFSFVLYTHLVVRQVTSIMTGVVDGWIESDTSGNDAIEQYVDRPYVVAEGKLFPVLRYILNDLSKNPGVREIVIYYYNTIQARWYLLRKDNRGYVRSSSSISHEKIIELEEAVGNRISYRSSLIPDKNAVINICFDITKPGDRNIYIVEAGVYRNGFLKYTGELNIVTIYSLSIFLLSVFISRVIALHISRPIQKLSRQASQIAKGNLDVRTDIISRDEIGSLSFVINTMADEIRDYLQDINERMEAMSVMNRIDKAVLSSSSRSDLVERVTSFVSDLFSGSYIALGIADSGEKVYRFLSGMDGQAAGNIYFSKIGDDLLNRNRNFYMFDPENDREDLEFIKRITGMTFSHFMNIPIHIDDEYIGSFVAAKTDGDRFTSFEVDSLVTLADQVGVAMKSVRTVEEKENMYVGIIMALSRAIDAKSKWTAGHSERVARYSVMMARELGLSDDLIRDMHIAAILHDIGKIAVPETLLDKPGRLTPAEYSIVKEHSYHGALIVNEIPGSTNVKMGVLSHHESWDGSGYPSGLQGEKIPLIARIITVADVYDSIVSDRPYRKGMKVEDAVRFLDGNKGLLFDPSLVDVMTGLIASGRLDDSLEDFRIYI